MRFITHYTPPLGGAGGGSAHYSPPTVSPTVLFSLIDLTDNLGILVLLQRFYGVVILAGKHLVEQALHTAQVGIAVLAEEIFCLGNLSHIGIGRKTSSAVCASAATIYSFSEDLSAQLRASRQKPVRSTWVISPIRFSMPAKAVSLRSCALQKG